MISQKKLCRPGRIGKKYSKQDSKKMAAGRTEMRERKCVSEGMKGECVGACGVCVSE